MDSRINARFYQVSAKPRATQRDFNDLLEDLSAHSHSERERDLGEGVVVRLERFRRERDFVNGEFSRVQTANIPPQTTPGGLEPTILANGRGLGHVCAFKYHVPTRVILLQRNVLGVTPIRLSLYLRTYNAGSIYALAPVIRKDALSTINQGSIRKVRVGFASPSDLAHLEQQGVSGMQSVRQLATLFKAPEIEITLSVGRKRNSSLPARLTKGLLRSLARSDADLKYLEATIQTEDGVEAVDLLGEMLRVNEELELSDTDPERNYRLRESFLTSCFREHTDYIISRYGRPG